MHSKHTMISYHHSINVLALSILLCSSDIVTLPIQEVDGFQITTKSFSVRTCASYGAPISLQMSTAEDDENNENDNSEKPPISGSFFNEVPPPKDDDDDDDAPSIISDSSATIESSTQENNNIDTPIFPNDDVEMFEQIIQQTKLSRGGSGGGKGFSKTTSTTAYVAPTVIQPPGNSKSFVGIGQPLNDVQNPEYDENGYTMYTDETTGEKSRVFEALVEYPSIFKMKIVGKDDGSFESDIVDVVAKSCGVERSMVKHTKRKNGKWTSVTVHAPVRDADMLYALYENVDKDPRVKVS